MADDQKTLDILIRTKAELAGAKSLEQSLEQSIGKAKALGNLPEVEKLSAQLTTVRGAMKAATDASGELAAEEKDLSASMEHLPDSLKNVGKGSEQAGHFAASARMEHMALHHAFRELDKICPGLGSSLDMMSRGMHAVEAGEEGAAVGAVEAKGAFESMMATILPLLAVMLTIQAITEYWDLYKESVEAAAKAQEEAMKRIQESTHAALKAVEELNEAMHPKAHTTAEKDEEQLKKTIEVIKEQHDRQKELNKANEDRELGTATTPEQKAAVKSKYAEMNESLDSFTKDQIASAQAAMAQTIKGQIAAIDATVSAKTKAESEQFRENAAKLTDLQKQKDILGSTHDTSKIDEQIAKLTEEQQKISSALAGEIGAIKNQAGDLGKMGEKVSGEAEDSAHKLGFDRETEHELGGVKSRGEREKSTAKAVSDAEKIADAGPQNQAQEQFLMRVAQLASGQQLNLKQAEAYLQNLEKHPELMKTVFDRLFHYNEQVLKNLIAADQRMDRIEATLNGM